jgi:hypothetical protein
MLIAFASCFRRRSSGTGKNEPPASLFPVKGLAKNPKAPDPQPSRQATLRIPHAGLKEETAT